MARTEQEKRDELIRMIRRDFNPKPPQMKLVPEREEDSEFTDYGLEQIIEADNHDDDVESSEEIGQ